MKKTHCILLLASLFACSKPPPPNGGNLYDYSSGLLILNEGLFQQNNATLAYYSYTENYIYNQVFYTENGRGLGDTANDMEEYDLNGNKYVIIAVDVSSQLEIVETSSLLSVAQIPVFNASIAREPRVVKVKGDKAYCCNFDGSVSIVNLNTFSIINTIDVGQNPDGMVINGNYLYVANSGGLSAPDYDSTVSVINLTTEVLETTINARINLGRMLVDSEGDLYVISKGNYSDVEPAIVRINTSTNTVVDEFEVPLLSWSLYNDWIYYYNSDLKGIYRFNTLTETFENDMIVDCSSHETFYKLHLVNNLIYTVDAHGYVSQSTIRCYDLAGNEQYNFLAGLNTNDIIFND
ncbi:hypothetical protein JYT74_01235 [Crocinitomix catalasitica]|nr:hypothetical protein [Crocinitomix catalasitica]